MRNYSFRVANMDDLSVVASISRQAYEPAYLPVIGSLPRPATENYEPWIRSGLIWICNIESTPVGVLVLEKHATHWMVWSLAVDPKQQGKGVGRSLLKQAKHIAQSTTIACLRLHTNSKMTNNISLYEDAGFYHTGTVPHPNRKGHELVYMQYDLHNQTE